MGRELIPPNLNVFWGINSAQDRASLEGGLLVKESHLLGNRLIAESWINTDENGEVIINDQTLKVFGLENVKYLLSYKILKNENLELVKQIHRDFLPPLNIFENKHFLPFAFGVFETVESSTPEQILDILFNDSFDPAQQVVIDSGQALSNDQALEPTSEIDIIDQTDSKLRIIANFSDPGYLYLSQTFFPGWQAYIDNNKAEVIRANYAFTAIKVPAGQHMVEFKFRPHSFLVGSWLTFLTIIVLIFYVAYYLFRYKNN